MIIGRTILISREEIKVLIEEKYKLILENYTLSSKGLKSFLIEEENENDNN